MATLGLVCLLIIVVLCIAYAGYYVRYRRTKVSSPLDETAEQELIYGPINPVLVCPHCRKKGSVRTRGVDRKKGISGGKATGAILTGGLSVMATGLLPQGVGDEGPL